MPNKHAAIKDLRKNKKHAIKNNKLKTHVLHLEHELNALIKDGKKKEALELVKKLQKIASKAAKVKVFHANKSSRKISKAYKKLNTLK